MRMRYFCCVGVVAILAVIFQLGQQEEDNAHTFDRSRKQIKTMVPAPGWIEEALRQLPDRTLSESEFEALERDGVVLLRNVVNNRELMRALERLMWPHGGLPFEETYINQKGWLYNGALRALMSEGPLGEILAAAHRLSQQEIGQNISVIVDEAPIWSWPASWQVIRNSWHTDARTEKHGKLYTVWMPLMDAPHPIEFMRGSHRLRDPIEEACAHQVPGGKFGFKEYNSTCVEEFGPGFENELGSPAIFGPDLRAGDVYVFSGSELHRGIRQTYARIALSIRGSKRRYNGEVCSWRSPNVFPRGNRRDLDCAPWAVLPSHARETPMLPAFFGRVLSPLHVFF